MSTEDPDTKTELSHGYWKSIAELEGKAIYDTQDSEIEGEEFPPAEDNVSDPLSRRSFFQLMGSSMALAGVAGAGCKRYEREEIVPLARRPEDEIPGATLQFATAWDLAGAGHALSATSYEGRPIHLDGNPDHPFANGGSVPGTQKHCGLTAFAAASILSLYDPDRSQTVLKGGKAASFDDFKTALRQALPQITANGARVRILSEASSSPTIAALRRALVDTIKGAAWYEYEPLSWDNERAGTKLAFGRFLRPLAKLDKAQTIVALDCDLFVEHPAAVRYNRDFAKSRRPSDGSLGTGQMSRLWSVESIYTSTGACADHRLPLRSEHVLPFLMALDARLSGGSDPSATFLSEQKVPVFLTALAQELNTVKGGAVLVAGRRQPAAVHALVAKINYQLGAIGQTIDYLEDPDPDRQLTHLEAITKLAGEIEAKTVETLIILGGNPAYDAPVDLRLADGLKTIPLVIHLSEYANETSQLATWHVPRAHFLEAWGDARTWDGTITLAQPLIVPMYGGVSTPELLALLVGQDVSGKKLVEDTYAKLKLAYGRKQICDGFLPDTQLAAAPMGSLTVSTLPAPNLSPTQLGALRSKNGEIEIVFAPSNHTFDGRFANNPWLQETPDFLTKVTWDNHALVSPATATDLGLENDTLIKIKVNGAELEVPCYTMPGQARYSIGVVLGGGRTHAGVVGGDGKKKVGVDTYRLRASGGYDIATGATVTGTGTAYWLANVQEHWDIRRGINKQIGAKEIQKRVKDLVRSTNLDTFKSDYKAKENVEFWPEPTRGRSLFREKSYAGEPMPPGDPIDHAKHAWGMAIDLNSCTGCNSCMVACQSENNVPVVGKNQVFKNREMHWIRIDRYFKGPMDDPEIAHQPLTCQQCENAPCEQVCPVGATQHSSEGLNDMAYNRCIGTRYCLNNCPYRVRRFNFFEYNTQFNEARNKVRKLLFNPDVTVRSRGVMEKCTFCVQRIQNGKIAAKVAGRPLVDGDIVTACQAACPSEAIVFGDLADPESRVSKLHADPKRAYGLLDEELYTKPRNNFLARVRNPSSDPALAAFGGGAGAGTAHEGGHE